METTISVSLEPEVKEQARVWYWGGTVCLWDGEPFEMAGIEIQPVRAADPIFRTHPRPNAPCHATPFGWVPADELVPVSMNDLLQDALENWEAAIRDVDQLAQYERHPGLGGAIRAEQDAARAFEGLAQGRLVVGVR